MAEFKWTDEQKKVIGARGSHILVSAAAGSGKTAVLSERIVGRLVEERKDITQFLLVTFTTAAAGEMKERIRKRIIKRIDEEEDRAAKEHLERQLLLLPIANISTIHTFCLSVIRDHLPMTEIPADFRTMDEGEKTLFEQDVIEQVLEEAYAEADEDFITCVETFRGKKTDVNLENYIRKIYKLARGFSDEMEWLERAKQAYAIEDEKQLMETEWMRDLVGSKNADMHMARDIAERALSICSGAGGPAPYAARIEKDIEFFKRFEEAEGFDAKRDALLSWEAGVIGRVTAKTKDAFGNPMDMEKKEAVARLRKRYADSKAGIIAKTMELFRYTPKEIFERVMLSKTAVVRLIDLTEDFHAKSMAEKMRRGLIDFNDMEHECLKILQSGAREEYRRRFDEVMVDEYQDISAIQEEILACLTGEDQTKKNRFMVGDIKQSIYRFRLSRPELFLEKMNQFDADKEAGLRIDLMQNFRSRLEVLDSCNALFASIMREKLGGVDYDERAALKKGFPYPEPNCDYQTEVMLLNDDGGADASDDTGRVNVSKIELEAHMVAQKIKELVGNLEVFDQELNDGKGGLRKACYRDVAILLRAAKNWSVPFEEVLTGHGIPVRCESSTGYFSSREIATILDYLRILDNPLQDIPLAATLSGPLVGISSDDMAAIAAFAKTEPFHKAAILYAKREDKDELAERLAEFYERLARHRAMMRTSKLHELLWQIIQDTGFSYYLSALADGDRRLANIDILIEKAVAFEATSYKGVFHFLRYLERLQEFEVDYGEAMLNEEGADTVTIMSIHKSKGLEYPIVIVGGLEKKFNDRELKESLIVHPQYGVVAKGVDAENRIQSNNLYRTFVIDAEDLEERAEEMRVLYVAMTRAREKLIMTGYVKSSSKTTIESKIADWAGETWVDGMLTEYYLHAKSTYLDWLMPVALKRDDVFRVEVFEIDEIREKGAEEFLALLEAADRMDAEEKKKRGAKAKELAERVEERLDYSYPFAYRNRMKNKFSVSEIKRLVQMRELSEEAQTMLGGLERFPVTGAGTGEMEDAKADAHLLEIPNGKAAEGDQVTGAARGTAYHTFLEKLDYGEGAKPVSDQLKTLVDREILSSQEADAIDTKKIERFLESSIGRRAAKADAMGRLFREKRFMMEIPATDIYAFAAEDDRVLLQGIVDLYMVEEDGIVLVDYKTDRVRSADELIERYRVQLDYYADAISRGTGLPVKEKIIYSLALSEVIELTGGARKEH